MLSKSTSDKAEPRTSSIAPQSTEPSKEARAQSVAFNGRRRRTIAELCKFTNGNGFRPSDWKSSGLPIIRIQNLNGSTDFNYFDGDPKEEWIVEPGDLLFAWAGVKGVSFGPTIWKGPKGVLNQHIYKVAPRDGVDRYWLYAALDFVTTRIESKAHGFKSSLVHVHKEDIVSQVVDFPYPDQQRHISAVLRTWEDAINKHRDLVIARRTSYSHHANQLLLGGAHLGDTRKGRQRQLAAVTRELTQRNGDMGLGRESVMGVSNSRGIVRMREQTIGGDLSRYKILPPRAFAYNPMRINVGSIAMSRLDSNVLVSPDYVLFECIDGLLDADYLDHLRATSWWSHYINAGGSGSVRMRTYYYDLAALRLSLPEFTVQKKISAFLNFAKREIELMGDQIRALERQKRGLMQKLLTGESQVKV